jgi:hypothetical protein
MGGDFSICNRYGITNHHHLGTFRTLKAANECAVWQLDCDRNDDDDYSETEDNGWEEMIDDDGCLHMHQKNDQGCLLFSIWVKKCALKD